MKVEFYLFDASEPLAEHSSEPLARAEMKNIPRIGDLVMIFDGAGKSSIYMVDYVIWPVANLDAGNKDTYNVVMLYLHPKPA